MIDEPHKKVCFSNEDLVLSYKLVVQDFLQLLPITSSSTQISSWKTLKTVKPLYIFLKYLDT